VAGEAGSVSQVSTFLYTCPGTVPALTCAYNIGASSGAALFTTADSVANPSPFAAVTVAQGQTIAVTVIIGFS
jgi:hypothetical protein